MPCYTNLENMNDLRVSNLGVLLGTLLDINKACVAAKMPSLHSHASAPGMVMAVGNVGQFLDPAADATCTFLSRDGGESWYSKHLPVQYMHSNDGSSLFEMSETVSKQSVVPYQQAYMSFHHLP